MRYRGAAQLQAAIHARLSAVAGVPVVDALPPGPAPATYVLVGAEEVRDASDLSGPGAEHRVTVSVISAAAGFLAGKDVAARLTEAMEDGLPSPEEGRIVSVRLVRAMARRAEAGALRRIDLTFRIRVEE